MRSPRLLFVLLASICLVSHGQSAPTVDASSLPAIEAGDYSFAYWLNGMRKHEDDTSADMLCFESGDYGFALDVRDFSSARFGRFTESLDYVTALEAGTDRLSDLQPAAVEIELESKGRVFRAVSSKAGATRGNRHLEAAWLWESGQLAQHYELQGLNFEDAAGNSLGVNGSLSLFAWPGSLTLTAEIAPSIIYQDGWIHGVDVNGLSVIEKPWVVSHDPRLDPTELSVECWVQIPESLADSGNGYLLAKNGHEDAKGHYSFSLRKGRVYANMNVMRGKGRRSIQQRGDAFKLDVWNHLVMTYDGREMRFYINGTLQGSESIDLPREPGAGALLLGRRDVRSKSVTQALFDQVRVWNRALTATEIRKQAQKPAEIASSDGLNYQESFDGYGAAEVITPVWNDVTMRVRLKTAYKTWEVERFKPGTWQVGTKEPLSLTYERESAAEQSKVVSLAVSTQNDEALPVVFNEALNCYVAEVQQLKRTGGHAGKDHRDYDDFEIVVTNSTSEPQSLPFLLDSYDVRSITGLVPFLCDAEGVPLGIPVQLSKNWHYNKLGAYLRAYTLLPAAPGTTHYKLRVVYGFYGTLPSASHAQLSLIGYGGNGRWDQLAIGSWGETICFDADMSLTDVAITDVRMLMARNGADGKKWSWTDAGWGGDWLSVNDEAGKKLYFTDKKTAYLAHGPCLTDVRYDGHYGAEREVKAEVQVGTLRTDDFARTFQDLRFTFEQELDATEGWLHKMGRSSHSVSPKIAYGNAAGLILEERVPTNLKPGELYQDRVELSGAGPWWIGFPGGYLTADKDWGTGSRALIIRSYRASFGGKVYTNPTFSMPVYKVDAAGRVNLDLLLTVPGGVQKFMPGDTVEMDVEWITFPRNADDYYGPNEAFRQHLTAHPESWQTIYREAKGNDLQVEVYGGDLIKSYPVIVRAEAPVVRVQIQGGCGAVPIRFEGLNSAEGHTLYQLIDGREVAFDQSVHGNDFWQTDYDTRTQSYKKTFNLPLDGADTTTWILRN